MSDFELKYFSQLKNEIGQSLFLKNKVSSTNVTDWRGNDIISFQDDLMQKVNGRISEKWFYTHIKAESDKLPRIDMLNMLSTYLDYKDWNDFKANTSLRQQKEVKSNKKIIGIGAASVLVVVAMTYVFSLMEHNFVFKFCFIDKDRLEAINDPIEIEILRENESSVFMNCDNGGCVEIESEDEVLRMVVRSAYYKSDTIIRRSQNQSEQIKLLINDYALMIHVFSSSEVDSWKERRSQLDKMLHNDVKITQINEGMDYPMEIYNKKEFINKLTMPTSSLKNIKILETKLKEGQIIEMRFIQKQTEVNE